MSSLGIIYKDSKEPERLEPVIDKSLGEKDVDAINDDDWKERPLPVVIQ